MMTSSVNHRLTQISQSNTARLVVALIVVSLVIRLVYLFAETGLNAAFDGDELDYHIFAESLYENGEWGTDSARATRPPVTPFLMSMVYFITGPDPSAARVMGVVISSFVPGLLYIVGLQFTRNQRISLLGAIGFSLYPPAIFYAPLILTENMTSLLVLGALGAFLWASRKKTIAAVVITGILWAILGLNRSVYILTPFALLTIQLLLSRFQTNEWFWSPKLWIIGLGVFVLTLSPWVIRNAMVLDAFVPTTTRFGHLLLMTNGTLDHKDIKAGQYVKNPELFTIEVGDKNEVGIDAAKRDRALEELKTNWRKLPHPVLNRAKNFWTFRPDPYDSSLTKNDLIMFGIWVPTLALFAVGPFVRSWKRHWPLLTFVLLAFATTLIFWGTPRFRFPVDALLILGAAAGFVDLARWMLPRFKETTLITPVLRWLSDEKDPRRLHAP